MMSDDEIRKTLGFNIREARMQAGMSQQGVAQKFERSRAAVANIEAGRQSITCDQLIELSNILCVDFRVLLKGVAAPVSVKSALDRLPPKQRHWIEKLKAQKMSTSSPPPQAPGVYEHYKGNRYRLLMTVQHSETKEPMVIYVSLNGEGTVWARPLSMWNEEVKTSDGTVRPRFVPVEEDAMRVSISTNLASE